MTKRVLNVAVVILLLCVVTIASLGANDKETPKDSIQTLAPMEQSTKSETSEPIDVLTVLPEEVIESEITETEIIIATEATEPEIIEPAYTEEDLFNLAAAVCREAGGASEEIQLLVANVVINRVNSPIYPDTIEEVLTQYKQYGMMWKYGISFPDWATEEVIEHCYDIAKRVLDGERFCPENVLFQAEFKQGSGVYKEFPGYYFCYYE